MRKKHLRQQESWTMPNIEDMLPYISPNELRLLMLYVARMNNIEKSTFIFEDEDAAFRLSMAVDDIKEIKDRLMHRFHIIYYGPGKDNIQRIQIRSGFRLTPRKTFSVYVRRKEFLLEKDIRCPACKHNKFMIQEYGVLNNTMDFTNPSELKAKKYIYICVNCWAGFRSRKDLNYSNVNVVVIPDAESAKRRISWAVNMLCGRNGLAEEWVEAGGRYYKGTGRAGYVWWLFHKTEWEEYKKNPVFMLDDSNYSVREFDLTDSMFYSRPEKEKADEAIKTLMEKYEMEYGDQDDDFI